MLLEDSDKSVILFYAGNYPPGRRPKNDWIIEVQDQYPGKD
jgi:hypothetical protein